MVITKEKIVEHIRRIARTEGCAPGRQRFEAVTGIKRHEWYGLHWARWGDALKDAGLSANDFQGQFDKEQVLDAYVSLIGKLGRIPTEGDIRVERRTNDSFPSHSTLAMRALQARDVTFTVTLKLDAVRRDGNGLVAVLGTDYSALAREREVDQVVVNHGTRPFDEIYFDLRPGSTNLGEVDYEELVEGIPQTVTRNPDGRYQLFRIGDAVSARNTHAAIYDALRLLKDI